MADRLHIARLYLVLLAIFTIGRWSMSLREVPYERGNPVFSIVTLTFLSAIIFAAFARRWRGYGLSQAALLGLTFGLCAQLVIFASTAISFAAGMETYFNHYIALNVPDAASRPAMGDALVRRAGGIVFGSLAGAIAGAIGWVLGALLPERSTTAA